MRATNARLTLGRPKNVPFSRFLTQGIVGQYRVGGPVLLSAPACIRRPASPEDCHSCEPGTSVRNTLQPSCSMSSSSGPENTWLALIDPFRQRLKSYNQTAISSEDEFRTALIRLCEQHREWQAQRLITRIRKQHSSIIDLARGIDTALNLAAAAAAGFAALVWNTAYTAARVSTVHTIELNLLGIILTACRRL